MKSDPKEHYRQLRVLTCGQLWDEAVPAFDRATGPARVAQVAVVRAVGVVFSESGSDDQRAAARAWLRTLLHDPAEKIRRYATAALPKLGAEESEESALLTLLESSASERETQSIGRALEKIGGAATVAATADGPLTRTAQKAAANLARQQAESTIRLDAPIPATTTLHLRVRSGLEGILADETRERSALHVTATARGLVAVEARKPLTLADVHTLRTFGTASLVLGTIPRRPGPPPLEAFADVIASLASHQLLETLTAGPIRYRLAFAAPGHQRRSIRTLGNLIYARCPALLNDSREAPWQIDLHETPGHWSLELTPRLRPDPRFAYRLRDVPAASHPPLAAAMVRLAGPRHGEIVWDPFCGSGVELIERALRGGVAQLIGTDLSPDALAITRENVAAAGFAELPASLIEGDFRDHAPSSATLIVTNPPLGRRVPIPDLEGLIADLFILAATTLRPGGRLVLVNPLPVQPAPGSLTSVFRQRIDLGGFHCHLERYERP